MANKPLNSLTFDGTPLSGDRYTVYQKPSGGIPKTDLSSAVQVSLENADAAIPAPSSPATGAFLVWNGSAWVAQTLSEWSGGNY